MVEYDDKVLKYNNTEYDLKGLKPVQVLWHLQEMNRPLNLLNNLNGKYTMPDKMHNISLIEGTDFDALLVDDKLFRYTKLLENDMNEVQEYINKYAYASALLKLNECATILGSGLKHKYSLEEEHLFISKSYDKLLENVQLTTEKGRLVESIGNSLELREGNKNYIRNYNGSNLVEDWNNTYSKDNIENYTFKSVKKKGNNVILEFIDIDGSKYEAIYENTNIKLLRAGINLNKLLCDRNLVESYKVGILREYNQPFTIKQAALLSYEKDGDKLKLFMLDAYGNRGYVYIIPKIGVDEFIKKYKPLMDEAVDEEQFEDTVDITVDFLRAAEDDIQSISRIKNLERVKGENENTVLPYNVAGFTPNTNKGGKIIWIDPKDKTKFKLNVIDNDGKEYNLTYQYTGDDIKQDILNVEAEIDDYDFSLKSEVQRFYQILGGFGKVLRSYPTGIQTSTRNLKRKEITEMEGVQTSDIAPKVDQDIQLVKVKLRKRKPVKESVTKLSRINEQDEFYNSRGFIKDENGRYHFGDYYINESGKVVHKSKLTESNDNSISIVLTNDNDIALAPENIVSTEAGGKKECEEYLRKLLQGSTSAEDVAKRLNSNKFPNNGDKRIFGEWKPVSTESDVTRNTYNVFTNRRSKTKYNKLCIVDSYDKLNNHSILKVYIDGTPLNESFNPEGYTNAIKAINAGIENDEDIQALQKYLQDIIGYCRSIAEDYGVLVEEVDFNDVTNIEDKLDDAKSIISGLVREYKDKYPGFCTRLADVYLMLIEIKKGTYDKLNEAFKFKHQVEGKDGIHSYYDMVWGQEPDSEYAKLILDYMKANDDLFDEFEELKRRKESMSNDEYNKEYDKLIDKYDAVDDLYNKAEAIPEKDRGQMYQDYLKIDKANDDEFAQAKGYKDYKEFSDKLFGLNESNNIKVGDEIEFYSTGYKSDGTFSNKPNIRMKGKVTKVHSDGSVSCTDEQKVKSFDYISPEEILKVNKLKESSWEEKCEKIFRKYRDEFDSIHEVYDLCDYINRLYDEGGMEKVDNEFFLPGASREYKKDFKSLINDSKLKESSNPELDRVLNEIKQEMHDQDTGVYDITSNDENEMYKFIDRAVKPILAKSSLDDKLKKEIAGWMEADIRDNKRWSIRTGVKAIMDWYKVK